VTLTVEVDGHVLTFEHSEVALGGRGQGGEGGEAPLEAEICRATALACAETRDKALTFVERAWSPRGAGSS
jgi:hypothetical protein